MHDYAVSVFSILSFFLCDGWGWKILCAKFKAVSLRLKAISGLPFISVLLT